MIRTTITMDEELTRELDAHIERSGAFNRSEAIRDLVRRGLNSIPGKQENLPCIGIISYTIDQTMPGLAKRLRLERLQRHDEIIFSASIPVDHTSTIDLAVMKGTVGRVNDFAQSLFLERGVRHGAVALTPIEERTEHHAHDGQEAHGHTHIRVQESF